MSKRADASGSAFWGDADDKEARERYRTLVNSMSDGICQLDLDSHVAAINDGFVELTGYTREDLLGEHVSVLLDEEGCSAIERETDRLHANPDEGSALLELTLQTAAGEQVPCELRMNAFESEDTLQGTVGVVRDVSERKRAQQRLEEERDMFAEGPAVVFRWENAPGWPVEQVSENVQTVFGYSPEELESGAVPYTELLLDDELDRIAREVETNSDETTERFTHEPYRVKTKGGDVRWVKDVTKIIRNETGDITHYLGYLVDITERKQREQHLERYKTIVEAVNDGVYVVDEAGTFQMVNETYAEMLGLGRDELLGTDATTVIDDELIERIEQLHAATAAGHVEQPSIAAEIRTAGGELLPTEATLAPLPDGNDSDWHRVGVVRDVTERREYQRKLEESNERLEQFAYAASHDLQEPLRMVTSYLQLIQRRYADALDEDGQEFVEFAVDGADRMRDMIQGLLEYSRVDTRGDPFESVDLDDVFADVREDLRVRIDETDAEVTADPLPTVEGDPGQLRQVFQNLLDNAIEYSGDEPPRIHISAERDGDRWHVSVRDEGIGIDPDEADRIFEIFQRLHAPEEHAGTGIGLSLCERIVERHGGEIRMESEPGEGSTFAFSLPVSGEPGE